MDIRKFFAAKPSASTATKPPASTVLSAPSSKSLPIAEPPKAPEQPKTVPVVSKVVPEPTKTVHSTKPAPEHTKTQSRAKSFEAILSSDDDHVVLSRRSNVSKSQEKKSTSSSKRPAKRSALASSDSNISASESESSTDFSSDSESDSESLDEISEDESLTIKKTKKAPAPVKRKRLIEDDEDEDDDVTAATKNAKKPRAKPTEVKNITSVAFAGVSASSSAPTQASSQNASSTSTSTSKYFADSKSADMVKPSSHSVTVSTPSTTTNTTIVPAATSTIPATVVPAVAAAVAAPAPAGGRALPKWLAPKGAPPKLGQKTLPTGSPNCLAYGGGGLKYSQTHGTSTSNTSPLTFVISGVLESIERDTAEHLIKRYGGRVTGSVTGKTDYLVCGADAGAKKTADATAKGVKVIDEDGLFNIIIQRSPNVTLGGNVPSTSTSASTTSTIAASSTSQASTPSPSMSSPVGMSSSSPPTTTTTTSVTAPVKRSLYGKATPSTTPATSKNSPTFTTGAAKPANNSDMWVEKWKPTCISDIVGNGTNITTILDFLQNWHQNLVKDQASDGKGKSSFQRAILLSGPPGIGKTTAATLCAQSAGFDILEFNASDVRSKNSIKAEVGALLDNHALSEYFTTKSSNKPQTPGTAPLKNQKKQRVCVIMDEVDGVSSSDRGGIAELIQCIKTTKTPMICICNDGSDPKMRSLKNYCLNLTWRRPTAAQIVPRMLKIAATEGLCIDKPALERLITSVRSDLRQTLNSLQMWAIPTDGTSKPAAVTYDMAHDRASKNAKDFDLNPFEVAPEFFKQPGGITNPSWLGDRINTYFVDSNIMPLFVQENYLNTRATVDMNASAPPEAQHFLKYCEASDLISEGDVLGRSIMGDQNFSLMPIHGAISTVLPGATLGGGLSGMLAFPSVLGKMSTTNKHYNLLNQLKAILLLDSPQSSVSLALDYLPVLRNKLMKPFIEKGADGMDEVFALMEEYGLSRADWDTILELGEAFSTIKSSAVESKVKAAFTRASKKENTKLKVTRFGENKNFKATKSRGTGFKSEEQEWEEINGENNDDDDDDEEQEKEKEAEKAKMLLQATNVTAKPKATKAPAKGKATKK